jgi:hypothetical protein
VYRRLAPRARRAGFFFCGCRLRTPSCAYSIHFSLPLCSAPASLQSIQTYYTLGPEIAANNYHVSVVRSQLTRNIATVFPDMHDELVAAFADVLPVNDDDSKCSMCSALLHKVSLTFVPAKAGCRSKPRRRCSRSSAGPATVFSSAFHFACPSSWLCDPSLCLTCLGRVPDWIQQCTQFAIDVMRDAQILRLFPTSIKPCVRHFPASVTNAHLIFSTL